MTKATGTLYSHMYARRPVELVHHRYMPQKSEIPVEKEDERGHGNVTCPVSLHLGDECERVVKVKYSWREDGMDHKG